MRRTALLTTLSLVLLTVAHAPATASERASTPPDTSAPAQTECGNVFTCELTPSRIEELVRGQLDRVPGTTPDGTIEVTPVSVVGGANGFATGAFACVATASPGAVSTRIRSCTSGPDAANAVVAPGSVVATGWAHTDTDNTLLFRDVCWEAEAVFADGSSHNSSDCTSAVVVID